MFYVVRYVPRYRAPKRPVIIDLPDVVSGDSGEEFRNSGLNYADYGSEDGQQIPGGDVTISWYDRIAQPKTRRPVKTSVDPAWPSVWALLKIAVAKLKTLKVLKFLVVMAVKLKLLTAFKLFVLAKLLVAAKILKFLIVPLVPGMWSRLVSTIVSNARRNATVGCNLNAGASSRNGNSPTSVDRGRLVEDDPPFGFTFVPLLVQFIAAMQSTTCVERTACYVAGFTTSSPELVWMKG